MGDRRDDILKSLRSSRGTLLEPGYGSRDDSLLSVAIALETRGGGKLHQLQRAQDGDRSKFLIWVLSVPNLKRHVVRVRLVCALFPFSSYCQLLFVTRTQLS